MAAISAERRSAVAVSPHSSSAARRAVSAAQRLPLSTVDSRAGGSGLSVRVSYQL